MSHLDPDVLALLAVGEPVASVADREHLAACDACTRELSSLTRTVAVARSAELVAELETPPERVWARIREDVGLSDDRPESPTETPVVAQTPTRSRRTAWARALFALAAGVAVVAGIVGTWALLRPSPTVEVASATLEAFPDHAGAIGEAVVEDDAGAQRVRVTLEASTAPATYREVWLITADASEIVSLGVLDGSEGEFTVPDDVDLHRYVLVDVSQEPEDGDPTHSGDSIVRGELEFRNV